MFHGLAVLSLLLFEENITLRGALLSPWPALPFFTESLTWPHYFRDRVDLNRCFFLLLFTYCWNIIYLNRWPFLYFYLLAALAHWLFLILSLQGFSIRCFLLCFYIYDLYWLIPSSYLLFSSFVHHEFLWAPIFFHTNLLSKFVEGYPLTIWFKESKERPNPSRRCLSHAVFPNSFPHHLRCRCLGKICILLTSTLLSLLLHHLLYRKKSLLRVRLPRKTRTTKSRVMYPLSNYPIHPKDLDEKR